jgi:hypothetical protein
LGISLLYYHELLVSQWGDFVSRIVYNSFKVGDFKNITTILPKDFGGKNLVGTLMPNMKRYYNISKPSKDYKT